MCLKQLAVLGGSNPTCCGFESRGTHQDKKNNMNSNRSHKAFLMALIGVNENGALIVRGVRITSSDQLTCQVQKQVWSCIQTTDGESYHEANKTMIEHIDHLVSLSKDDSIWHTISKMVNR